jgi:hypothetical protein
MLSALVAVQGLALSADKEEKPTKTEKADERAVEELGQIDLAHGLIEYGRKHKSPEALVVAARMLAKFPVSETKGKGETEGKENQVKGAEALLDEAAKMRSSDKLMGELVAAPAPTSRKGREAFTFRFTPG